MNIVDVWDAVHKEYYHEQHRMDTTDIHSSSAKGLNLRVYVLGTMLDIIENMLGCDGSIGKEQSK